MSTYIVSEARVAHYGGAGDLLLQVAENDGDIGVGLALDSHGKDMRMCSLSVDEARELQRAIGEAIDRAEAKSR